MLLFTSSLNNDNYTYSISNLAEKEKNQSKNYSFIDKLHFFKFQLELLWTLVCGLVCYVEKAIERGKTVYYGGGRFIHLLFILYVLTGLARRPVC